MTQSMSRVSRCIDNGPMEAFWGMLKSEMYYLKKFHTYDELKEAVCDYIDYYNVMCPVCDNKTRIKIRKDTELINFPLYCPKCRKESLINVKSQVQSRYPVCKLPR